MNEKMSNIPDKFKNIICLDKIKNLLEYDNDAEIKVEDNKITVISYPKKVNVVEGYPAIAYYNKTVFSFDEEGKMIVTTTNGSFTFTDAYGNQIDRGDYSNKDNAIKSAAKTVEVYDKDMMQISRVQAYNDRSKAQCSGTIRNGMVSLDDRDRQLYEVEQLLPIMDKYGNIMGMGPLASHVGDMICYDKLMRDENDKSKAFYSGYVIDGTFNRTIDSFYKKCDVNMEHLQQYFIRVDDSDLRKIGSEYVELLNKEKQNESGKSRGYINVTTLVLSLFGFITLSSVLMLLLK